MIDWEKYANVISRATGTVRSLLGSADAWGQTVQVALPLATGVFAAEQVIRAEAVDAYSRNWMAIGNIAAAQEVWDAINSTPTPNIVASLEMTMGVGKARVVQSFNLGALVALAAPWYVDGANGDQVVKAFAISGGIVGRTLNARVVFNQAVLAIEDPHTVDVTVLVAPLAAGFPL